MNSFFTAASSITYAAAWRLAANVSLIKQDVSRSRPRRTFTEPSFQS
jgi:hypothetical protein